MTEYIKDKIMSQEEFQMIKDLISKEFGILIKGDKRLTLHTKISYRLGILGLTSYREYHDYIIADTSKEELFNLASHITNNETYFFREKTQLDVFNILLNDIKKEKSKAEQNSLRILSLACSSGEEAYSLSIIVNESRLFAWNWDVKITGIDIDKTAVKKARDACYSKNSFRLNGNIELINKYFEKSGECYILKKPFSKNTEFRHANLLDSKSFAGISDTDIIFCRNVFIYMSDDAIQKIVKNLYRSMSNIGYLFLGTSESLIQKTDLFFPEYKNGIIVYRKNVKN